MSEERTPHDDGTDLIEIRDLIEFECDMMRMNVMVDEVMDAMTPIRARRTLLDLADLNGTPPSSWLNVDHR